MATEAKLEAKKRTRLGSSESRRLRLDGLVPANLYGHNQPAESIVIDEVLLRAVVNSGARVVDITVEGKVDKAVVREVQYDAFGVELQHIDLMRVDPNERVRVTVPIELKGTAPGALAGGILEQPMHAIEMDVLAYQIPDSIQVKIGALALGQAIHVRELALPESAHAHVPADAIVVHVVEPRAGSDEAVAAPGEPEVIGKKIVEAGADAGKDDKKKK